MYLLLIQILTLFEDLRYYPHKIQAGEFFDKDIAVIHPGKPVKQGIDALRPLKSTRSTFYAVKIGTDADMIFSRN